MSYQDEFEVVWSGKQPLLPERESKSNHQCWVRVPSQIDLREWEEERESRRYKRGYTKRNTEFWAGKSGAVRHPPADTKSKSQTEGDGHRGQCYPRLPDDTNYKEGRIEDTVWPTMDEHRERKL